jgi:hypothetical protein
MPPTAAATADPGRGREGPARDSRAAAKLCAYSMTSSARSGSPGGMFNPTAFAVFMLMTGSAEKQEALRDGQGTGQRGRLKPSKRWRSCAQLVAILDKREQAVGALATATAALAVGGESSACRQSGWAATVCGCRRPTIAAPSNCSPAELMSCDREIGDRKSPRPRPASHARDNQRSVLIVAPRQSNRASPKIPCVILAPRQSCSRRDR